MSHVSALRRGLLAALLLIGGGAQAQVGPYTWTTVAPAPMGRYEALAAVADNRLYVFGGFYTAGPIFATARCDVYDPATNQWTQLADMPEAITHASLAHDGQGSLYLAGGYVGTHPGPITDHVWRYHIATNTWSAGPPLPAARGGGVVVCRDRTLHFFGGAQRFNGLTLIDNPEHWALNLDAPTPAWVPMAPLPNPRNHLGGTVLNGKVYAVGGQHLDDEVAANQVSLHEYDPATNQWRARADMPRPLGHITSTVLTLNNRLLVVAGVTNTTGSVANIIEYDPTANTWRELPTLPAPRHSPTAGVVHGRLLVTGGTHTQFHTETWLTAQVLSAAAPAATPPAELHPNPVAAGQAVRFRWPLAGPVQVQIADVTGRVRYQGAQRLSGGQPGQLPTAGLPAGLYVVSLRQGEQLVRGRLLVQ